MSVAAQMFLKVGGRMFFKPDNDSAGVQFALRDLGVLQAVSPAITFEKLELEDADGGIKRIVDEVVSKIDESYEIQVSNVSMRNMSLLYAANPPSEFAQVQTERVVSTRLFPGELLFAHDGDAAKTRKYNLDAFAGIYTGTVLNKTLTSIVKATKTFKLTGDHTAVAGLAAGKSFIVQKLGLTNIKNSNTYRIVSNTLNAGSTDLVVEETPDGDESGITGSIIHEDAGVVYRRDVDFEVVSLLRGLTRILAGGALSSEQDVTMVFTEAAVSGKRLIQPQTAGLIKGKAEVWFTHGNFAKAIVREANVSITPSGADFNVDDYASISLTVKILSDVTESVPAGRMIHIKGTVPDLA